MPQAEFFRTRLLLALRRRSARSRRCRSCRCSRWTSRMPGRAAGRRRPTPPAPRTARRCSAAWTAASLCSQRRRSSRPVPATTWVRVAASEACFAGSIASLTIMSTLLASGPQLSFSLLICATGSPDGHSHYMESRPSAAALSPAERASAARLQAMADIVGRTLQGTAHRRLHLVPSELNSVSPGYSR